METSTPPENSSITVESLPEGLKLSWPLPSSAGRFFVVGFLCFWLCGWAFGEVMVFRELLAGRANLFMLVWLGGWSIGGVFALLSVWNALKPMQPESVQLSFDSFTHYPGFAPLSMGMKQNSENMPSFKNMIRSAVPIILTRQELNQGFVLDRVGERQRLRFDHGAKRIEIGSVLTEPEREWLHQLLEQWRVS